MIKMTLLFGIYLGVVLISAPLNAQDVSSRTHFEVASVKPTPTDQVDSPGAAFLLQFVQDNLGIGEIPITARDRVRLQEWTLRDLIAAAYSVRPSRVSGPDWLAHKRFDIEAKMPVNKSEKDLHDMLQSLLEERFALAVHSLSNDEQVFVLTVDEGGPRLAPARAPRDNSSGSDREKQQELAMQGLEDQMKSVHGEASVAGFNTRFWPSITVSEFAKRLERFTGAPVMDQTGLAGKYSVRIEVSNDPDSKDTLFNAVAKLGLKLERRKMPVTSVVVDRVSKIPIPN